MSSRVVCNHSGCANMASRYPRICMVAKGHRRGQSPAMRMVMPIATCADCQQTITAQNFLLPEGCARIVQSMFALGRAVPDFDNAWLEWGRVGNRDWIMFYQMEASRSTVQ